MWNDEQFVEAARALAARTLAEPASDERARLARLFTRCTIRSPAADELDLLAGALTEFRARYAAAPTDAQELIEVGEAMISPELDPVELAAWTMLANGVLNLDSVLTRG